MLLRRNLKRCQHSVANVRVSMNSRLQNTTIAAETCLISDTKNDVWEFGRRYLCPHCMAPPILSVGSASFNRKRHRKRRSSAISFVHCHITDGTTISDCNWRTSHHVASNIIVDWPAPSVRAALIDCWPVNIKLTLTLPGQARSIVGVPTDTRRPAP